MSSPEAAATTQSCPACGHAVDVREAEPLARIACPHCGEKFHVDRAFDHFALLETLGVGGMGSVYKARDTRLDRFVALKILRPELSAQPDETARLEQEARLTAAVNHPHIVQVFSSGNDRGQFYLVMELVDHGSLDDLLAEHGKLPELQVLEIGIQIAQGLQAAEEKGLIHRDIKPANILFANERTAKIGDFGLAVAAGQNAEAKNEIWGTPYYVAPERLNNEPEDFRSDIFSLGATLFHAIAGVPPLEGESTSALELRALKSQPPDLRRIDPQLSRATAGAINSMITPDPRDRFQSYAEVIAALARAKQKLEGGGFAALLSARNVIAAVILIIAVATATSYLYHSRMKAAAAAMQAREGMSVSLAQIYDDARRQLIAGKFDVARAAFARVGEQAGNRQPILNWIRLHRGLAALLRGYGTQARQAFEEIEKGGPFSTTPADAELARFFVETAHTMLAATPLPAAGRTATNPKTPQAFATFLFAMKDWQLGDFASGAALLEQFVRSESTGAFAWINEYKPLAQKYLADHRVYSQWKARPQNVTSVAAINETLAALRAARSKIEQHSRLSDALKDEEAALSRALADRQGGDGFRGTPATTPPPPTNSALKLSPQSSGKKAGWLVEWKTQFIADLRRGPLVRPVTDSAGKTYDGISSADETRVALMLPYGVASVGWEKVSPKSLLEASLSYVVAGRADAADRQWRCAVFASETGQGDAARALGETAAKIKPEYREHLALLGAPSAAKP